MKCELDTMWTNLRHYTGICLQALRIIVNEPVKTACLLPYMKQDGKPLYRDVMMEGGSVWHCILRTPRSNQENVTERNLKARRILRYI